MRVCYRLVAGRQTFRMAIGGWVQDLLLFEPFSNLRGSLAGCAQGEDLLYDGCGFFIDDPFLFVLWVFHKMLAGLAFALPCSANGRQSTGASFETAGAASMSGDT